MGRKIRIPFKWTLLALLMVASKHFAKASPSIDSKNNTSNSITKSNSNINNDSELCLKRASDMDKCLPKLVVYGDRKFEPPQDEQQMDKHCLMLDENLKCVLSYSRECLPSFARNLYSVMTRRLKVQFAKRCKTKNGRQDFLILMACADLKHMEPAHKCMDGFIANLEHVGQGAQNRQIELSCCIFQLFQECIFDACKRMQCKERKVTYTQSSAYVKSIIKTMGGDMMELISGRYDSVSACKSGYPKFMDEFGVISQRVFNGTLKPRAGSPLRPMLQLFIDSQQSND